MWSEIDFAHLSYFFYVTALSHCECESVCLGQNSDVSTGLTMAVGTVSPSL